MINSLDKFEELDSLSGTEKEFAIKILEEFYNKGTSKTYNDIVLSEYEEIPVDIEIFLKDESYLGKGLVNDEGVFTVFPYWVETLKKIFPNPLLPAAYNTLALSGAIGLGKSFVAVLCGLYELYRMICLKDPYMHYGLQPIDKITFAFMNITLDASKGVAWDKCQQLLQSSPWFMKNGTVSGTTNIIWNPPKGIELIAGSLSRHILGRAVYWCLDGDTNIVTTKGDFALKDLVGKTIQVPSVDDNGNIVISDECTVQPTAVTSEEYQITFEDGTIIKCTPEHRFMLKDGTYKEAQNLTTDDDILEFNPVGYVYKTTNKINGNIYIGKRQCSYFDKSYYGSGKRLVASLKKYGKENFTVEILDWAKSIEELRELEEKYIDKYFNLKECINIKETSEGGNTVGGKIRITNGHRDMLVYPEQEIPDGWQIGSWTKGCSHPSEKYKKSWTAERKKQKSAQSIGNNNPNYGKGCFGEQNGRYGKEVSQETRGKIGQANKGKIRSEETKQKISNTTKNVKKPDGFGEKISKINKGKHLSEETKQKLKLANSGKNSPVYGTHIYNNGFIEKRYFNTDIVPPEFKIGRLKKGIQHNENQED